MSPVAETPVVPVLTVIPSAEATVPDKVPPDITSLPEESNLAVPPKFCICDIKSPTVVEEDTFKSSPSNLNVYPPDTALCVPSILTISPRVVLSITVAAVVTVITEPKT